MTLGVRQEPKMKNDLMRWGSDYDALLHFVSHLLGHGHSMISTNVECYIVGPGGWRRVF